MLFNKNMLTKTLSRTKPAKKKATKMNWDLEELECWFATQRTECEQFNVGRPAQNTDLVKDSFDFRGRISSGQASEGQTSRSRSLQQCPGIPKTFIPNSDSKASDVDISRLSTFSHSREHGGAIANMN